MNKKLKIAITGHTSGIGLGLASIFRKFGHEVIGFSLATGYDIGDEAGRKLIVEQSLEYDVFINNAYHVTGQPLLLEEILQAWNGKSRFLMNISSIMVKYNSPLILGEFLEYKNSKMLTDSILAKYSGSVRTLNIIPGLVHTQFYLATMVHDTSRGMNPNDLASLIFDMFKYRDKLKIKELLVESLNT